MKRKRPSKPAIAALLALLGALPVLPRVAGAAMGDYCQVPPYVVQNIQPNVVLLLDQSASMMEFAYFDLPSNRCTASGSPCTTFNPSNNYYGYFDPAMWYTYGSNTFSPAGLKTAGRPATSWDGNFLNWLTMRKIDVVRKVITGGAGSSGGGSSADILRGEPPFVSLDGFYKRIANAGTYTPFSGTKDFTWAAGSSGGNASFTVSGGGGTFRVWVRVPTPVEGVLQSVVGARARLGLALFNNSEGAKISVSVTGSSLSGVVNKINNPQSDLGTSTPLGEALWSVTGYYALQDRITGFSSGPGPEYFSADIPNNANNDPMNYGSGGQARYPVCAKNFVLLVTDGEPCSDGNIPSAILNYANGKSAYNCGTPGTANSCPAAGPYTTSATISAPGCGSGTVAGLEDVALFGHTKDLRNSPTLGVDNIAGNQNYTLYAVLAFGSGSRVLRYAAINGGFEDSNGNGIPDLQSEWDKNGDNEPDTYYEASDGDELERSIRDAFSSILKRASSGTAASVLASGEGSGANLVQAVFYPRRSVGNDIVWWTGSLQNMWYYVDPFFANATIREDTDNNAVLHLVDDYIVQFYFDPVSQLTQVRRYVSNDNGVRGSEVTPPLRFEEIHSLWEAGKKLWQRTNARTIKTTLSSSYPYTFTDFSTANAASLSPYMLPDTGDDVTTIIKYVQGIDNTDDLNLRPRTVAFGSDNNVWKLGDVVNSTPRIVASVPLNKYDTVYNDTTYKSFIDNTSYKNRGMVFTGGNDGMLHAFRLGKLELSWTGKTAAQKARITDPFSSTLLTTLGDEQWAFIPKNALPYLKYLKDPDYCHLYYADLAPYVFDASIGGAENATRSAYSWRTVLIGGMRTGGACDNSVSCTTANNCVKTPGGGTTGFSSYFALDVTDPVNPSLMWEFPNSTNPNPGLGFTTTGPAVVRINAVNTTTSSRDQTLNGEWYVVLGSGPTGPIDNTNNQFLGRSNQNLKFFVLNLKTGALLQTIDTTITEAFAGSMINSVADFAPVDYQDDAIYVGYVKKAGSGSSATWTDGGVGRILTKNVTPNNSTGWVFSKVIDGIGPVTSSVARLQNKYLDKNWLFFGTGRYFFENPPTGTNTTPEIDDADGQRRLFGIKDPCFSGGTINPTSCASVPLVTFSALNNATVNTTALTEDNEGWYINLEGSANYSYDNTTARLFRSERVITDPLATTSGVVFFTTYKPYGDECALGGKSFLWALRYTTGDAPIYSVMKGKALVQVSTASVEQIDLSKAFKTEFGGGMGGRRTGAIEGVPPTAQGLSLLSLPPPVNRIMHMMER